MIFASTRPVQIATVSGAMEDADGELCLHTLRADCNDDILGNGGGKLIFASTRSVQIATAEMHRIAICTFQNVC